MPIPIIKFKKLSPQAIIPSYAHPGDAGADLVAMDAHTLEPLQRLAIPTGLAVELPQGYELQVRPKSSLALKHGITVLNTPGTVDAGYRGEIKVILINLGQSTFEINPGQRIAQIVIAPVIQAEFMLVDSLGASQRGEGGFGSTGKTYAQ
ncbi:deoxyuridine 5 -triphosphate nucleotidohydrolase [Leptolyngbya sp. Heron Island J]|uniref:dUTP diphosphatase n=1 Tax=Leptolyngbya sp. Heron Island J TaxID=1385935 RepID=UPI0003B9946F|nr:dUTP diphosphatase [Leptolyngbya sp. Heron Island J]ESA35975.1 deoxyuridine 5 -triphosphate nucleotidohydrolase [Leptolyngbya sp. Heron Island J]